MARVGNVPVVSAYRGNVGQQMMKVSERLEGISEDYERKQKNELAEAKKLYTQGLNYNLYEGINELRNDPNYSANPKGLSDAMDKVLEKTLSDVTDDEVKSAVMVDYQLKKGTYINHAQTEFNRIQREKARSSAFDTVYANIDSMGLSFANALSGNYTDDDIANYMHSLENIKSNINARDVDGTYIFTDAQRRSMMKDAEGSYLRGFKAVYEQLDEQQQEDVTKMLDNDSVELAKVKNGEEEKTIKLEDVIGETAYKDIKDYVKKQNRIILNNKIKEKKYQGLKAVDDFRETPSEENLEKLYELNPTMSDKTKEKYREILESDPVYQAEQKTFYTDMSLAQKDINDFISKDFTSDDEKLYELGEVISKINKSANKGNLEEQDVNKLKSMLLKSAMDKQVAQNVKQFNAFNYTFWDSIFSIPIYKSAKIRKELEDMALPLQRDVIEGLSNGASAEEMKDLLRKSKRMFINFKYPEIDGKEVGDTINKRGITYKIISLDPVPTLEPVE